MSYFSTPRNGLVLEVLGDGSFIDTNDGTKQALAATNVSYENSPVGYQKQRGVFNGSNSYVDAGYLSACEFGATSNFEFHITLSCTGTRTDEVPLGFTDFGTALKNWAAYFDSSGKCTLILFPTGGGSFTLTPTIAVNDGKTHFLRFVHKSDKTCQIWIDGVKDVEGTHSLTGNFYTAANRFAIGNAWVGPTTSAFLAAYAFGGSLQAARVFNRVLSDDEYRQYVHEFNRKLGGGSDFGAYIPTPVHHGLGPKNDDVANLVASTSGSPGSVNDRFGIASGAESFNGTARMEQYSGLTAIASGASRTFFVLCRGNTAPASVSPGPSYEYGQPISGINTAGSRSSLAFNWNYTTGYPSRFRAWNMTNSAGTTFSAQYASLSTATWYVLAASQDQSGGTCRIFKDGVFETSVTISGTFEELSILRLGGDNGLANFNGDVAEWAVFPGALSDAQVKFVSERMLSGRYPYAFRRSIPKAIQSKAKFYAPDGRYNVAQSGYDLSPVGSPTTVRAQQNTCVSTAATGNYLANSADIPGCDIAAGNPYTLACWLKSSDVTGVAYYLYAGDATTPLNLSILLLSGVIQADWSRANVADDLTSTGLAPDGKWHHVAATFSGGVTKVYLDGYLKATGSYTDSNGTGSNAITGISVARGFDSSTQVSDPFVTNSELTQEEIRRLMLGAYRN